MVLHHAYLWPLLLQTEWESSLKLRHLQWLSSGLLGIADKGRETQGIFVGSWGIMAETHGFFSALNSPLQHSRKTSEQNASMQILLLTGRKSDIADWLLNRVTLFSPHLPKPEVIVEIQQVMENQRGHSFIWTRDSFFLFFSFLLLEWHFHSKRPHNYLAVSRRNGWVIF